MIENTCCGTVVPKSLKSKSRPISFSFSPQRDTFRFPVFYAPSTSENAAPPNPSLLSGHTTDDIGRRTTDDQMGFRVIKRVLGALRDYYPDGSRNDFSPKHQAIYIYIYALRNALIIVT